MRDNRHLLGTIGGKYHFKHCTFANYWNKGFRTTPAVLLNDYAQLADGSNFVKPLTEATFENCIIEGNQFVEFYVEQEGSDAVNFYLDHTAVQFESSNTAIVNNPFFDWDDNAYYNQIIRNGNPAFVLAEDNDMRITQQSDFLAKGDASVGARVPVDLAGKTRTSPPDLGSLPACNYRRLNIEKRTVRHHLVHLCRNTFNYVFVFRFLNNFINKRNNRLHIFGF